MVSNWDSIKKTIKHAVSGSPFYKKQWKEHGWSSDQELIPADFSNIPFTYKQDLRNAYPDQMLAVPWQAIAMIHESSGTTGEPTPSYFTKNDLNEWYSNMLLNGIGLNVSDVVLIKTPYSMLSTAHQMHGAARLVNAVVIPAGNRSSLMPYSRVIRILKDYKPTVIYSMPIELLLFARVAVRMGLDPAVDFPWIRGCVVNGEMLSNGKQMCLERLWNTKIYQDYGSTETGTLGGVCRMGNLHLWSNRYYFEVENINSGHCSEEGTGELILTSLNREAMPLIRYRTEDIVTVAKCRCKCGLNYPEAHIWGRKKDIINCQGRSLYSIELENIIYNNLIGFKPVFWTATINESIITIYLEHMKEDFKQLKVQTNKIKAAIKKVLSLDVNISLVQEGTMMKMDIDDREQPFAKPIYIYREGESMQCLNYQMAGG